MSLILNIDTSTERASICLAEDGKPLHLANHPHQKDHAAWLQVAIQEALRDTGTTISSLKAVAVTAGPGSYTGLRVSMASAKGLCYALQIPLIAINTLEAMAFACREADADLLCPMIDARRMEVFTAIYNKEMNILLQPSALVLEPGSFDGFLQQGRVLFSGNGSKKWASLLNHKNALWSDKEFDAGDLAPLSFRKWEASDFSDIAYTEPIYIKDFYIPGFHS